MNIGVSFYFGYQINPKLRAKMIKDSGFDCVITNADNRLNKQNGSIKSQIKFFKKNNIKLSSLHMQYKNEDLVNFWLDNKTGNKLEKTIKRDLKIAKKYGFSCVVVHLDGEYSEIGEKRLYRILELARKLDIPIANENINRHELFVRVMDSIDDEYLKFCYDSGHNNVFDSNYDYLSKYGERLIALHLHDNDGKKDQHTLNKYGTIDWDKIATLLSRCRNVNLDYELLFYSNCDMSPKQVLEECYKQGKELEKLIEEKRTSRD